MSGHSPEPWTVRAEGLRTTTIDSSRYGRAVCSDLDGVDPADQYRIARCVNALAGISDEDLASLPPGHLARVFPIVKDWRDREFEAIGETPDIAAIFERAQKSKDPS